MTGEDSSAFPGCNAATRVYGTDITTDIRFGTPSVPAQRSPKLAILRALPCATLHDTQDLDLLYESEWKTPVGAPASFLFALPDGYLLRISCVADFTIRDAEITVYTAAAHDPRAVEIHLFGAAMAIWLERQGILALHASALSLCGRAIAFLSDSGAGKSTLAAALLQSGAALLSDDITPVEMIEGVPFARPAFPQLRLWPEEVSHFLGPDVQLDKVHPNEAKLRVPVGPGGFGRFEARSLPIKRFYIPQRDDRADIRILPIPRRDALVEMVRNSFVARAVMVMGLQPARLTLLTSIVKQVPVMRLIYPSDRAALPRVCQAVINDLNEEELC
ncbi:MAG TPA: hypothetical protein VFJ58_16765 [Armatimonadota bacterium]|nr:hypothetical protein [Armatimonadota bacterium]